MNDAFAVKLESFEGPLAVLLSMVEKRKMHPSDIPLAKVTDDYIAYVREREIPGEELAEFILVAATLMLIKSRALLPRLVLSKSEEASIEDLENRVSAYREIQSKAAHLRERLSRPGYAARRQPLSETGEIAVLFRPPKQEPLNTRTLRDTLQKLLATFAVRDEIPQTVVKKIKTLEEVLASLVERVAKSLKTDLHEFAGGDRQTLILSFLAILELAKQGAIFVSQADAFSRIDIETREYSVPRYT